MKIPESVRIGGVEYPVEKKERLIDGTNVLAGQIDYMASKIYLSADLGHQTQCQSLLHEILHGIREHAGMQIENEEAIVEMYSKGLYQVLQDNGARLFDLAEK